MKINDVDKVRIFRGGAPVPTGDSNVMTPNGNIYVGPKNTVLPGGKPLPWSEDYSKESLAIQSVIVHEGTHLWQHNNNGCSIACFATYEALFPSDRNYAYRYEAGKKFSKYGLEEQAQMVQDRFLLQHGSKRILENPATLEQLNQVVPFK